VKNYGTGSFHYYTLYKAQTYRIKRNNMRRKSNRRGEMINVTKILVRKLQGKKLHVLGVDEMVILKLMLK